MNVSLVMVVRYGAVKSHQSDTVRVWLLGISPPWLFSVLCLLSDAPYLIFQSWWPVKSMLCSNSLAQTNKNTLQMELVQALLVNASVRALQTCRNAY